MVQKYAKLCPKLFTRQVTTAATRGQNDPVLKELITNTGSMVSLQSKYCCCVKSDTEQNDIVQVTLKMLFVFWLIHLCSAAGTEKPGTGSLVP